MAMVGGPLARPAEEVEVLEQESTGVDLPARVILYNDDWHTFEEVILQLMKATGCGRERAEALTWEVHIRGKAAVYEGTLAECLRVSNILEEIALHTQIEY
ncbi:MAG: ATP-dependent Clp protease adaptor ClpS [Candidatus Kapabacteria bacterium]|nr:ATP-dependent Clp protease adaptor ClpS [Candidatus Kapabacteria bacterium]MDW8226111.1 ATP-dependent Clp protease adaptor ClpS [Bacteroidota bacterium]